MQSKNIGLNYKKLKVAKKTLNAFLSLLFLIGKEKKVLSLAWYFLINEIPSTIKTKKKKSIATLNP